MERIRQLEQALHELVNPRLWHLLRQGERQEYGDRVAAHGGNVAEAPGETAMANGLGGVPLAPKMNSLQAEIGSNQRVVTYGDIEDGAIIPDASGYALSSDSPAADAGDQRFFGKRHDGLNIQGDEVWAENLGRPSPLVQAGQSGRLPTRLAEASVGGSSWKTISQAAFQSPDGSWEPQKLTPVTRQAPADYLVFGNHRSVLSVVDRGERPLLPLPSYFQNTLVVLSADWV